MSVNPRKIAATAALLATTVVSGGCDLLNVFEGEGSTLVQLLVTHHATPRDGSFPDLSDGGEARTFDTDEGWTIYLRTAFVTTSDATLHACNDGSVDFDPYWGPLPENIGHQDLDLLSFAAVEVEAGQYCSMTVEYSAFEATENSDLQPMGEHREKVQGATFYFEGAAMKGDLSVPFELRSTAPMHVDLDLSAVMNGGPLSVTANEAFPIDLTLSKTYDRLFDGIDFESATTEDLTENVSAVLELETRVAFGTRVSAE